MGVIVRATTVSSNWSCSIGLPTHCPKPAPTNAATIDTLAAVYPLAAAFASEYMTFSPATTFMGLVGSMQQSSVNCRNISILQSRDGPPCSVRPCTVLTTSISSLPSTTDQLRLELGALPALRLSVSRIVDSIGRWCWNGGDIWRVLATRP